MTTKAKDVRLSIRIDPQLREDATEVFNSLGLDMTTAVRMFLTQSVTDNGLPFQPQALPVETQKALHELDQATTQPSYDSLAEMKRGLNAKA